MGISLGGGRRRRSYADYGPRSPRGGGGNDPFRIIIYLVLIGGVVWFYFNHERFTVSDILSGINVGTTSATGDSAGPAITPTFVPSDFVSAAEEAYAMGDLPTALLNYQEAAAQAPNQVDYHVAVARLTLLNSATQYEGQREATLQEALEAADRAVLADPESARGYAIKAMALDWNGQAEEASLQAQRAIEIDAAYAPAWAYLAEAYVDMDRWDQAQDAAQQALALDPFDIDVHRNYAYVFESLGSYDVAAQHYEQALAVNDNLTYLHLALGRAYRVLGRTDDAIDEFITAGSMQPNNPISYLEIGWTYHTAVGDDNSALEYLEQAVDLDSSFSLPWVRIGTIHYVRGGWAEAIIALERANSLIEEDDIDLILQLGVSYASLGECDDAARYLRQAQQLADGDERVQSIAQSAFEQCADSGLTIVLPTLTPAPNPSATPLPTS